jgi:hypothetical protein
MCGGTRKKSNDIVFSELTIQIHSSLIKWCPSCCLRGHVSICDGPSSLPIGLYEVCHDEGLLKLDM